MPVHYSTQGWVTGCGIDLEHLGETDRAVEDLALVDCDSCLEDAERARSRQVVHGEPFYHAGYQEGKSRSYLEMANWRPGEHDPGCGCMPCLTGGVMARRLAETWITDAVTLVIDGKLDEDESAALWARIAGSAVIQELLEAGAWAQAITEAYNQARAAMPDEGR